jgi:ribonuclease D
MNQTGTPAYIDSLAALRTFCSDIRSTPWAALDTEFLRERTYFPRFCLLQVATPVRTACIDPLSLDDLSPLDAILDDSHIVKVFHAGRQDLEILYRNRGRLPAPIFDTQVAAPYIGLPEQIGYGTLASELLGIKLEKGHTRTDWSMRPLSPDQLGYAADDVTYLGEIYLKLRERLASRNRLEWVHGDMIALCDPELYDPPPTDAWMRIGGTAQLNEGRLAVLAALAAWRESLARQQDSPRNWIVKDEVLVELARQSPRHLDGLMTIKGIDERIAKRFGAALVKIITETGTATPPSAAPSRIRTATENPDQEALLDVFSALLRMKAAEHSLNPAIIASRKELRDFLGDPLSSRLMQGWRAEVAGNDLFAMMTGDKSLRVVQGALQVTDSVR